MMQETNIENARFDDTQFENFFIKLYGSLSKVVDIHIWMTYKAITSYFFQCKKLNIKIVKGGAYELPQVPTAHVLPQSTL